MTPTSNPSLLSFEDQCATFARKTRGVHPITQHGGPRASRRSAASSWALVTFS